MSNLIVGSTQIGIGFGAWKERHLNWAFGVKNVMLKQYFLLLLIKLELEMQISSHIVYCGCSSGPMCIDILVFVRLWCSSFYCKFALMFWILLFDFQRDCDMGSSIRALVQPQIVLVGTLLEADLLYIVMEGSVLCHIPHQKFMVQCLVCWRVSMFSIFHTQIVSQF